MALLNLIKNVISFTLQQKNQKTSSLKHFIILENQTIENCKKDGAIINLMKM